MTPTPILQAPEAEVATENNAEVEETTEVEQTETPTTEAPEATDEVKDDETKDQGTQDDTESEEAEEGLDADALQKQLKRARNDAAKYRTQLREAQASLEKAKTPEEFEAALDEVRTKADGLQLEINRRDILRKHQLPDPLPSEYEVLFHGATPEELEASAKAISALRANAPIGRGGLTPQNSGDPEANDDEAAIEAAVASARRRGRKL